jgi:ribonuclease HI
VIADAGGRVLKEIGESIGLGTSNIAEYQALIRALAEAKSLGADEVLVLSDSELLVEQVSRRWKVRAPHLVPLRDEAVESMSRFPRGASIRWVPREQNTRAHALADAAL